MLEKAVVIPTRIVARIEASEPSDLHPVVMDGLLIQVSDPSSHGCMVSDIEPEQLDRSRIGLDNPEEQSNKGSLTCPVGSHETYDFSRLDRKVDGSQSEAG